MSDRPIPRPEDPMYENGKTTEAPKHGHPQCTPLRKLNRDLNAALDLHENDRGPDLDYRLLVIGWLCHAAGVEAAPENMERLQTLIDDFRINHDRGRCVAPDEHPKAIERYLKACQEERKAKAAGGNVATEFPAEPPPVPVLTSMIQTALDILPEAVVRTFTGAVTTPEFKDSQGRGFAISVFPRKDYAAVVATLGKGRSTAHQEDINVSVPQERAAS